MTRMEVSLEGPVKAEKGCTSCLIKEKHTHIHTHTPTHTHHPSLPRKLQITNNN